MPSLSIRPIWAVYVGLGLGGCFSIGKSGFVPPAGADSGGSGGLILEAGTPDTSTALPPDAPHALLSVSPPHGPFNGGVVALLRGNGFTSNTRAWFGTEEVPTADLLVIDPQRIQVTVPAGHAGSVDVSTQNGDDTSTQAILTHGYDYDSFYADPSSGPTSGGTSITLTGDGTNWDDKTSVTVDGNACDGAAQNSTTFVCTTPPGTQGSKPIAVTTGDGVEVDVLDAFTYSNSDNGFKGGLSGGALGDSLRVIALDYNTGVALAGATVIVGDNLASADVLQTDLSGVVLDTASVGPKRTVTVAHKCYQPITFVNVAVDTVTAYLMPVQSPLCGSKIDIPGSGGSASQGASVSGELVWTESGELKRNGWTDIPMPKSEDEHLVAYVFRLSSDPTTPFSLPPESSAVTPESSGARGYSFSMAGDPGNFSLYALAGIENRTLSPPQFTAYAMGLLRGVAALGGQTQTDVYVPVDVELDHALTLALEPPTVTSRGPDRVRGSVAVRVGTEGYAILPSGNASALLPLSNPLSFVGVPPLINSLSGTSYVTTASAVTGPSGGTPLSSIGLFSATSTDLPITLDQFVQVPALVTPAPNSAFDGKTISLSIAPGGATPDLFVLDIEGGGGLVDWQIVAPGDTPSFTVPDPSLVSADLGLAQGSLTITVSAAKVTNFSYGALRYRQLTTSGWSAYAQDIFFASY
ncbi:MAG TPA: IPT/TIG domain-containing protein [Polyangiaceae bacterium]